VRGNGQKKGSVITTINMRKWSEHELLLAVVSQQTKRKKRKNIRKDLLKKVGSAGTVGRSRGDNAESQVELKARVPPNNPSLHDFANESAKKWKERRSFVFSDHTLEF